MRVTPDDDDFPDSQLYVIRPNGHALRQFTHLSAETELLSSSFSPDGKAITYAQTGRDGLPDIFTQQLRSGKARQVTSTALWESAPDWGPQPR